RTALYPCFGCCSDVGCRCCTFSSASIAGDGGQSAFGSDSFHGTTDAGEFSMGGSAESREGRPYPGCHRALQQARARGGQYRSRAVHALLQSGIVAATQTELRRRKSIAAGSSGNIGRVYAASGPQPVRSRRIHILWAAASGPSVAGLQADFYFGELPG